MKNFRNKYYLILLIVVVLINGCSTKNDPIVPPEVSNEFYLVINEGLYGQNNSSITVYDIQNNVVQNYVYSNANGGENLGDTANDFMQCCGKGFVVLDKSKKIEIISLNDFKSLGSIDFTDYGSPRDIVLFDSLHAYVSTLNDLVVEINPTEQTITRIVKVGKQPEDLEIAQGKLFVANSGFGTGNSVSVIDLNSFSVIDTIEVWKNPRFIKTDGNFIYLISTGEYIPPGTGAVTKINVANNQIVDTLLLNGNPGKAEITSDVLYVIYSEGVAKISLDNFSISDSLFISGADVNSLTGVVYSVYYDKENSLFLCGNPKDFMQDGNIIIFDEAGSKLTKFNCGLNPGTISLIKNRSYK